MALGLRANAEDSPERWEEQTRREGARDRVAARPAAGAGEATVDTQEEEEEVTMRADSLPPRRRTSAGIADEDEITSNADDAALATGSGEVGLQTMDEPTVDELAKPLPPLSVVPPIPAGKRGKPQARASVAAGRLMVVAGNDSGREFDLTGKDVTIGRGVDCDLVLTDIAVSRKHVTVEWKGRFYHLKDLGSGNGTLLNDRIEDGACELRHGDRLELGNTVIRFEHPASKPEPAAVGWGNQADVDEEASTIAGRGSMNPEVPAPRHLRDGAPRLVLPAGPPGAVITADAGPAVIESQGALRPDYSQELPQMAAAVSLPLAAQRELLLPRSNNKLIIGVISATLGVVLIAIVATLIRGGDETAVATGQGDGASVAATGTDGDDPASAEGETAPVAADDSGDAPANDETAADPPAEVEVAANPPADETAADPPPAAARPVPMTTWGTNEVLLASRAGVPQAPAPAADDDDGDDDEKTAVAADRPKADKPAADPPKADKPRVTARSQTTPKIKRAKRPSRPARPARTSAATSSSAQRKAASMYQRKDFNGAAEALRAAAQNDKGDADKLRALATNYETVGVNLTRAQSTQTREPTSAMAAYRRALALDKRVGGSAHAAYIRIKLGQTAPKAAASYMAQKRYEAAKKAADSAVNYGAGADPTVKRVRQALERKAADFYKWALGKKKSNPPAAKKTLRRILQMVPPDSPYYAKAYKLLNERKKARDEDE